MWKPLIRCTLVGGLIVFLWGALSWVVLPFHRMNLNHFSNPEAVQQAILDGAPKDGIYVLPNLDQVAATQNPEAMPFFFVSVARSVNVADMNSGMVCYFITQLVGAFIVSLLLLFEAKVMRYWKKVGCITLAGVFVAVVGMIPLSTWWHFPACWVTLAMMDYVVGWFLAGMVMAKLSKKS